MDGKGYMTHRDFVQQMTLDFTPGDEGGVSKKIADGSDASVEEHNRKQRAKHAMITSAQINRAGALTLRELVMQLR